MKKIRPSKRFMEKLRASGKYEEGFEDGKSVVERGVLDISASSEEVAEALMRLGCEEVFLEDPLGDKKITEDMALSSTVKRKILTRVFRPSEKALKILRAKYHSDPNKITPVFDSDNCLNFAYRPGKKPLVS